ncbi:LptF/LptG family permease [Flavobacteriaceae bacterium S356]|uniref:LptF/LptG family permease n=1 Tax=Asprobacillus argus TaxID=3076534 RepID=A0ABU3LG69_9FLAO|nr:LptF/LptG family permease [Flavobacteriaceae bacterium S356]
MKILDKYLVKSFLVPFFATFFIILFVLVMQALWLAFDDIAGKGISIYFILKFLYYTCLIVSPQALPIAVLLSSIMVMGNLAERYEFAAAKSASISLMRLIRPLIILTFSLSALNFILYNNIFPYAVLKQKNLLINIRKKKPALALIPGSFNSDIPDYQIKFDEKYGENEDLLKNVMIYDLTSRKGNQKVITAENGKIISEDGSKYMTMVLYNGKYYENHVNKKTKYGVVDKMPASSAIFDEYTINIDISSLTEGDLEIESLKRSYNMLTLKQLKDTLPNMKIGFDEFMRIRAKNIYENVEGAKLGEIDTIQRPDLAPEVLDNFNLQQKIHVLSTAISKAGRSVNNLKANKPALKNKRKFLNLYDLEYHNRIALSLACLILFFIGAPLGSIIRKGGFGLPMILAISIYVIYFFSNTFSRNLAEESSVTVQLGSWISAIIMAPIGFLLMRRASKGMGIFNIDVFLQPITKLFKRFSSKKAS